MKNKNRFLLREGGQRRLNQFNTISQSHSNTNTETSTTQIQWKTNRLLLRKGGQGRQNRLIKKTQL